MDEPSKICDTCLRPIPLSGYYRCKANNDGYLNSCRKCDSVYQKQKRARRTLKKLSYTLPDADFKLETLLIQLEGLMTLFKEKKLDRLEIPGKLAGALTGVADALIITNTNHGIKLDYQVPNKRSQVYAGRDLGLVIAQNMVINGLELHTHEMGLEKLEIKTEEGAFYTKSLQALVRNSNKRKIKNEVE